MDGRYETWVDRQIREAQERGEFDNLPGAGKPLRSPEQPPEDDWWVKQLIERERLDMTAALPPQLALRKEGQTLPDRMRLERSEQAVRELLEDFNARVRECWRRPMDGPLAVVRTVDVEAMVETWRAEQPPRPVVTGGQRSGESPRRRRSWAGRALARLAQLRRPVR